MIITNDTDYLRAQLDLVTGQYETAREAAKDWEDDAEHYKHELDKAMKEVERLKNQWISVKDRLPRDNDEVLTHSGGHYDPTILFYSNNRWAEYAGGYWSTVIGVTHWMPLPEAPKENNDE